MRFPAKLVAGLSALAVVLLAVALFAHATWAAESDVGVTEGVDKNIATESRTWNGTTGEVELMTIYPSNVTTLNTNHVDVAVTDTAVRILSDATKCRAVAIKADADNSTFIVVGGAAVATSNGFRLYQGDTLTAEPPDGDDCGDIFINGTSGDGASVFAK